MFFAAFEHDEKERGDEVHCLAISDDGVGVDAVRYEHSPQLLDLLKESTGRCVSGIDGAQAVSLGSGAMG